MCQGRYQIKPSTPFVPGSELAGEVVSLGDGVTGVDVGDRVVVFSGLGAFAEQIAVPALSVLPMPDGPDLRPGGGALQSYGTALFALTRRTSVAPASTCSSSGRAVAWAWPSSTWLERSVPGSSRRRRARRSWRRRGRWARRRPSPTSTRTSRCAPGPCRTAGSTWLSTRWEGHTASRRSEPCEHFGRFCVIGFAAGPIPTIPLNQVLLNNRTVVGVDWGGWMFRDPNGNQQVLAHLAELVREGRVHPTAPTEFPLASAAGVMADLIDRSMVGKAVLVP